jgi:hypothetical protein
MCIIYNDEEPFSVALRFQVRHSEVASATEESEISECLKAQILHSADNRIRDYRLRSE